MSDNNNKQRALPTRLDIPGELEEYIDMVAERIAALGGLAMGTARIAAKRVLVDTAGISLGYLGWERPCDSFSRSFCSLRIAPAGGYLPYG